MIVNVINKDHRQAQAGLCYPLIGIQMKHTELIVEQHFLVRKSSSKKIRKFHMDQLKLFMADRLSYK